MESYGKGLEPSFWGAGGRTRDNRATVSVRWRVLLELPSHDGGNLRKHHSAGSCGMGGGRSMKRDVWEWYLEEWCE